jgi:hypothetical protein
VDPDVVIPLLINLASLSHLISLTINTEKASEVIDDIYQLIFALPTLKYNSFCTTGWDLSISLPMATNRQFSTIETLVINHYCTFDDLAYLTSYTPKLRHLSVSDTSITDPDTETIVYDKILSEINFSIFFFIFFFQIFFQIKRYPSDLNGDIDSVRGQLHDVL